MIITLFLKVIVQYPRPGEKPLNESFIEALMNFDYYSFPSGHTARAAAFALSLGYVYKWRPRKLIVLLFVWAFLVSLSRIVLGVHWPFDIVGAWIVSSISLFLSVYISKVDKNILSRYQRH